MDSKNIPRERKQRVIFQIQIRNVKYINVLINSIIILGLKLYDLDLLASIAKQNLNIKTYKNILD